MEQNKFFSIIIPTYNSKKIQPAYDSIEKQTIKDLIEVIIVDDNSAEDQHLKMLENYTFDYKIIKNTENKGPGISRQIGIENSSGEWFTFLDHDDEFTFDGVFETVKNILDTGCCKLILDTQIMTAYDYNYNITKEFNILINPAWLHGKFFNREQWNENNLSFHPTLKSNEDTYLMNIIMDMCWKKERNTNEKWYLTKEIVTYIWYLFSDSTSHSKTNNYSYLENNFQDYITSIYDALLWIQEYFPDDTIWQIRFYSLIISCYIYYEKYNSINNVLNNKENNIRKLTYKFLKDNLKTYNLTIEEVIDFIYLHPSIYRHWYLDMSEGEQHGFVPSTTIKDFLLAYDTID